MNTLEPLTNPKTILTHQDVYDFRKRIEALDSPSFDPAIFSTGLEISAFYITGGYVKFLDFAHKMLADIGQCIRPFLKSLYSGIRYCPGMESWWQQMSSVDFVDRIDIGAIKHDNKYYMSTWKNAFGIWYASEFLGRDSYTIEWLTEQMVKDFGESIRPEIKGIYNQAGEWFKHNSLRKKE